jgi:hypothetical protein
MGNEHEIVVAIDPGTSKSGLVVLHGYDVVEKFVLENDAVLDFINTRVNEDMRIAIEWVASFGMPVGAEVFDTCRWVGRFAQMFWLEQGEQPTYITRKQVKMHLCGSMKAKDGNVRQAIIDMYPATGGGKIPQIGTKKEPGPLFGINSHIWSALAVALTFKAATKEKIGEYYAYAGNDRQKQHDD